MNKTVIAFILLTLSSYSLAYNCNVEYGNSTKIKKQIYYSVTLHALGWDGYVYSDYVSCPFPIDSYSWNDYKSKDSCFEKMAVMRAKANKYCDSFRLDNMNKNLDEGYEVKKLLDLETIFDY